MRGSLPVWIVGAVALAVAAIVGGSFLPGSAWRAGASWFAVYFVVWWLVLFAVLPMGVKSQQESGDVAPGTDPGAPADPGMGRKLLWTTLIAAVVVAAFYPFSDHLLP